MHCGRLSSTTKKDSGEETTNQKLNVQLISTESRVEALELNIITWSGLNIDDVQEEKENHTIVEWVWKAATKELTLDVQKQKETFLQVKEGFYD